MAVIERTYNIPLRREFLKTPKYKRSKKAVTAVRQFLKKHMKSETIHIGKHLNDHIWKHGIKNPPHHVNVQVKKDNEGKVVAELVGKPMPMLDKVEEKKESMVDKLRGAVGGKKSDEKVVEAETVDKKEAVEEKKVEKKEEAAKEKKE